MEILNIILARKQDPIRAIVIKNPIETPEREMEKGTVMDIKAETDAGELLNIEMQANSFGFYQSRALFYGGRLGNLSLIHIWCKTINICERRKLTGGSC